MRHLSAIATGTDDSQDWRRFRRGKQETRDNCSIEQFGLCAFSEVTLSTGDLGMHLDHVVPRSKARALTFEHANLLLSAIDDIGLRGLAKSDVFGGHARGNRYSKAAFIQPLLADCQRYFYYSNDGDITPRHGLSTRDHRRALYTIKVLNLKAPILVSRRRIVIQLIEDEIALLLDSGNAAALESFAKKQLCPQAGGSLLPFHSGARDRFGALGDTVLSTHCPSLA